MQFPATVVVAAQFYGFEWGTAKYDSWTSGNVSRNFRSLSEGSVSMAGRRLTFEIVERPVWKLHRWAGFVGMSQKYVAMHYAVTK